MLIIEKERELDTSSFSYIDLKMTDLVGDQQLARENSRWLKGSTQAEMASQLKKEE